MSGKRRYFSIFKIVALAIAAVTFVVSVEAWLARKATPEALKFVPVEAQAHLITGPIGDLWNGVARHFSRAFSSEASLEIGSATAELRAFFDRRCVRLRETDDLKAAGLDDTQGAALAWIDEARGALAVLPIADRGKVEAFLKDIAAYPSVVTLDAPDKSRKLLRITVQGIEAEGVKLCLPSDPMPAEPAVVAARLGDVTPDMKEAVRFHVAVVANADHVSFAVACTAIYADGTGACRCSLGELDCSARLSAPAPVFDLNTGASKRFDSVEFSVVPADDAVWQALDAAPAPEIVEEESSIAEYESPGENLDDGMVAVLAEPETLVAVFPRDGFLVLAHSAMVAFASAEQGIADTTLYQNDDSRTRVTLDISSDYSPGDGLVLGAVNVPSLPVYGSVAIAALLKTETAEIEAFVPWRVDNLEFLERVLSSPPEHLNAMWREASPAELKVFDVSIPFYLSFLPDSFLKTLKPTFDRLRRIDIDTIGLDFAGVYDAVPSFILSVGVGRSEADEILLAQRRELRLRRDQEILEGALRAHFVRTGDAAVPASGALELVPEEGAVWDRFTFAVMEQVDIDTDELVRAYFVSPSDDEPYPAEFFAQGYSIAVGAREIEYIAPVYTQNDVLYRQADDFSGETAPESKLLLEGRYRLAAYYDEQSDLLLIGSDAQSLVDFLDADVQPSAGALPLPAKKAVLRLSPATFVDQLLAYPDEDVRSLARDYLQELEQFGFVQIHAGPAQGTDAVRFRAVAGY